MSTHTCICTYIYTYTDIYIHLIYTNAYTHAHTPDLAFFPLSLSKSAPEML